MFNRAYFNQIEFNGAVSNPVTIQSGDIVNTMIITDNDYINRDIKKESIEQYINASDKPIRR
jgi:hypothetical protein